MHDSITNLSRRHFLAGAGLVIGVSFLAPNAFAATLLKGTPADVQGRRAVMNAFIRIAPDDIVHVLSKHIEFGQGPYTGLATLVAEELDADWSQIRAVASPADDKIYANLIFGVQGTGGSSAIANSFEQMRKAGAMARAMLIAAAAREWKVPVGEITIEKGRVKHVASGKESGFGALAEIAATMSPPANPALKRREDFVHIGKDTPKLDTVAKSRGEALYTIDVKASDMLVALVTHADHFGATPKSFDDSAAREIPGVVAIKAIPQGVAVFGENTFAALKGRDALKVEWDLSKAERRSSAEILAGYRQLFATKGLKAAERGNVEKALAADGVVPLEAEFEFPFLAHAPMEPLDAVIMKADDGSIDCYTGAQFPGQDQRALAEVLGVAPEHVRVHTQLAGGSFGRRAQFGSPYMREAAEAFKAAGMTRPVKHMWTREDDIRGGYYRPIFAHKVKVGLSRDGDIAAWDHQIAGQSILKKSAVDETSVEGVTDLPYTVANLRVQSYNTQVGVPVLWWRSVGHTHTAFVVESLIDELLEKAGKDPVEGRLTLLKDAPRQAGVLKKVAEMADWGGAVPDGRKRGVAVHKSFHTYVAEIAEVSIGGGGAPRVHRVWCAVDCGIAVNPNIIKAQMEGGIGFGLGAVLFDEVTLGEGGRIVQSNFHDYRSLRINEMPEVEVAVVDSTEPPTGVGEPGTPPIGPALANAWRRLTGQPVRRTPIVSSLTS
jgi:isoquinoline 1-oxidoreductase subunit beta